MNKTELRIWAVLLTVLILAGLASAQTGTSSIRGTVLDPQGNVIPGAKVTITNVNTNATRSQTANPSGSYSFEFIPPGNYKLDVDAKGFDRTTVSEVHALVGSITDRPITMRMGTVVETVSVQAEQVTVNSQDATLGNNFINKQIVELPLEARNVLSLVTLQPQVTQSGYVAGARSDQSNITLDGVDINDAQSNDVANPVLRLNSEAVEEFRVVTSNATASQGRSSGAQVNLVTKSGTNNLHGSLFEAHRNTVFTANDYFNNLEGVENPKLIRNTFGAAVGGPIKKDKIFFFYSYEGRRDAADTPVDRVVPLASLGQGNLRYLNPEGGITTLTTAQLNEVFPDVGINPLAVAALAEAAQKYPANSSQNGDLMNTAGYRFNAKTPKNLNSHILKFDFNITDRQTLFVRGNLIRDEETLASMFPDTASPIERNRPIGLAFGHTWTIGKSLVNNFRYGLTRTSYHRTGDSHENQIFFRYVFEPLTFTNDLTRTNPVHNFTDDVSWLKGNHALQFGTNIRILRNDRTSYGTAYDIAMTNPSMYSSSGYSVSDPIYEYSPFCTTGDAGCATQDAIVQDSASALIGRFSQFTANFNFDLNGKLMSLGAPNSRKFAMQEYEFYVQDTWRVKPNLTLNAGLRYGVSRPVYETQGYGTRPNIPLNEYFQRRVQGAYNGNPYTEPISIMNSGTDGMYNWDTNNFQPSVGFSWSPRFQSSFLKAIFGENDASAIRGGFRMTNDYYGQQIAVAFDLNNTLGYSQSYNASANQYNVTTRPAPLFTGYGQDVRTFPAVTVPGALTFPNAVASDMERRIESSLDQGLVAPTNYTWNLTFERQLPKGLMVQMSYIGRLGRHLLANRDIMAINDLRDTKSGMDWYTAAGQLAIAREQGVNVNTIAPIPYFENLWPDLASVFEYPGMSSTQAMYQLIQDVGADYTYVQDLIDYYYDTPFFYQPQYGALSAWGTIANSNYHGGSISIRERLGKTFTMDLNYTYSHSLDDASGLQTSGSWGAAFILNPIRQRDNYANSDFDIRHQINANWLWQLPFGRERMWGSGWTGPLDTVLGGWAISGILRWNTGLPTYSPFDDARWATNWQVQSSGVRIKPLETCPTRGSDPKLFGCDPTGAFQSWRNARPGETGERNVLRLPNYIGLDMGLAKTFKMPWREGHELQFRWDVFNVPNHQAMGAIDGSRTGFGLPLDPSLNNPAPNFSNFTGIQGNPRVMQFGLRYAF